MFRKLIRRLKSRAIMKSVRQMLKPTRAAREDCMKWLDNCIAAVDGQQHAIARIGDGVVLVLEKRWYGWTWIDEFTTEADAMDFLELFLKCSEIGKEHLRRGFRRGK